jgi:gas vesicle protein
MGEDPNAIRADIERTRADMGDTVDALGYKADVKSRAKDRISDTASVAQENPLGLAIGGVAVGFLAGILVPSSRVEDEKLGPMADQVKDQIKETGQEALEHGKAVISETASSAADAAKQTAQEKGQEHASQLQDSAQQSAQETRDRVSSS